MKITYVNEVTGEEIVEHVEMNELEATSHEHGEMTMLENNHGKHIFNLQKPYYVECKDKHGEYILDCLMFVGVQDGRLKFDDLQDNTLHIAPDTITYAHEKNDIKGVTCVWFNEKWKIVKMNGCLMATSHDGERSTGLVDSMYAASQSSRIPKYVLKEMKRQFDLMFQKFVVTRLKSELPQFNTGDQVFFYVNNVPTYGDYISPSKYEGYHTIGVEFYDFDANEIGVKAELVHENNLFRG